MSFKIQKVDLDKSHKDYIVKNCNIYKKKDSFNKNAAPECLTIFKIDEKKNVYIPMGLWKDFFDEFPNDFDHDKINAKFLVTPKEEDQRDQQTVLKASLEKLYKDHYLFLALRTGFGKTFCSLNLICQLGLQAVVLCHNTTLHEQWVREAKNHCPDLKIQIVKKKLDPNADVYIMGIIKSTHYDRQILKRVGTVVVDEAHLTFTTTFTDSLLQFRPKYLIGLSATPDRSDGLHKLLYPFFGPKKEFIERKQKKSFTVVKYETRYKPEVRYSNYGRMDWDGVIKSLSFRVDRQQLVINIVDGIYQGQFGEADKDKKKKILILCSRICTILGCENYEKCNCLQKKSIGLNELFKNTKYSFDYVCADKKDFDNDCNVLIGSFKKLSVGFDSDRDVLILESDITDVRQAEGRIRKNDNLIIDIVDDNKTLEKHWNGREKWYRERGATINVVKR